MAIDFTRPLPRTLTAASPEEARIAKRIRSYIQELHAGCANEARQAAQDRKYGERANAIRAGRGDLHIHAADAREDEARTKWEALSVAYHKWSGTASGAQFSAPLTAEEIALLCHAAETQAA